MREISVCLEQDEDSPTNMEILNIVTHTQVLYSMVKAAGTWDVFIAYILYDNLKKVNI